MIYRLRIDIAMCAIVTSQDVRCQGKLTQTRHAPTFLLLDTKGKLARFSFFLVSGACGCAAPSAERFMLIAPINMNPSGEPSRTNRVREGSPSRRSY